MRKVFSAVVAVRPVQVRKCECGTNLPASVKGSRCPFCEAASLLRKIDNLSAA